MASANRISVSLVRESTAGVTPTTPRMRTKRLNSEALTFAPTYVDSDELRSDRMMGDPILTLQAAGGTMSDELSYPDDESPDSELYRSAFFSTWSNTAQRFNDGTADSVITNVATSGTVVTVTTGTGFAVGQLVRFTGFGVAGNNGIFRCTTASATVPAFTGSGITDESAPPAAALMKVVGFQGASGDITALADGLGSTLLDFTTLGLLVGQWVKIGGTLDASQFAFLVTAGTTPRKQAWARITAVAAAKITLDNLPSGWTTDSGTSKTIKVWFGDRIKNGTAKTSVTIEKGFLDQTVPTYIVNTGMEVGQVSHSMTEGQKVTRQWTFMGMGGSQGTTALDASPDAQTLGRVMASHANVGRIAENGSTLSDPNWARSLTFAIDNGLRSLAALDSQSPVAVNEGECSVTGNISTYFGSNSLLAKRYLGTITNVNARVTKDSQALVFQFPRVTFRGGGDPNATGKNTDIELGMDFTASMDTLTSSHVLLDRLPYIED